MVKSLDGNLWRTLIMARRPNEAEGKEEGRLGEFLLVPGCLEVQATEVKVIKLSLRANVPAPGADRPEAAHSNKGSASETRGTLQTPPAAPDTADIWAGKILFPHLLFSVLTTTFGETRKL